MASIYDKMWLPIKTKPKPPEPVWTSRAETFNSPPHCEGYQKKTAGLFHISGLQNEAGLEHIIRHGTEYLNYLINEAEETIHVRPVWSIIENFRVFIHEMKNLMLLLIEFHPDEDYQLLASNAQVLLDSMFQKVRFSNHIYRGLMIDGRPETTYENFIAREFIRRYEKRGFGTNICEVNHVVELHRKLEDLVEQYKQQMKRRASDIRAIENLSCSFKEKKSLSTSAKALENDRKLQMHSMISNCHDRHVHYLDYYSFDNEQAELLEAVLEKRYELAKICGFNSFVEKSISETPFASPKEVTFMIKYLADNIKDMAVNEYSIMDAIKKNIDGMPLLISDVKFMRSFIINHISREKSNMVGQYLTLGGCIDGINKIFEKIFFITFDICSVLADEIFAPDVYKLQVGHVTWGLICYVYLDLMKRPGKPQCVTHYVIREGKFEEDNEYLSRKHWRPTRVVLVMSLEYSGFPTLLSINEAENLFAEMGKLIPKFLYHFGQQYILRDLCNINVQNLFEFLMKRLFYHPKIMAIIFRRYPDGQVISEEDMQRIICSRKVLEASFIQELVLKAAVDQAVYSEYPLSSPLTNIFRKVDKAYYNVPMFDDCYIHLKDSYLVDDITCGKFFMKLVDRAVAISLWKRFFEKDPLNPISSDDFMMCLYESLPISDFKESYSQILGIDIDLIKIGNIILDDAKESYESSLNIFENAIDETGAANKPTASNETFAYSWTFD